MTENKKFPILDLNREISGRLSVKIQSRDDKPTLISDEAPEIWIIDEAEKTLYGIQPLNHPKEVRKQR